MGDYRSDYRGIGDMLCSEGMQEEMLARAEKVMAFAIASAPFDAGSKDGMHYKDAFSVGVGVREGKSRRAIAVVSNDDPAAPYIEHGTSRTEAHHTMLRALDAARD